MKNRILTIALAQAARLQGKSGRIIQLAATVAPRISSLQKRRALAQEFKEGILTFGRMITAYARGHYRNVPVNVILKSTAAILYFVNPLDLVPDAIIGVGLLDDAAVLSWVLRTAGSEISKFKNWETCASSLLAMMFFF